MSMKNENYSYRFIQLLKIIIPEKINMKFEVIIIYMSLLQHQMIILIILEKIMLYFLV